MVYRGTSHPSIALDHRILATWTESVSISMAEWTEGLCRQVLEGGYCVWRWRSKATLIRSNNHNTKFPDAIESIELNRQQHLCWPHSLRLYRLNQCHIGTWQLSLYNSDVCYYCVLNLRHGYSAVWPVVVLADKMGSSSLTYFTSIPNVMHSSYFVSGFCCLNSRTRCPEAE